MTITAVGAQWGDEGKGCAVDYLAQQADLVIRYQGATTRGTRSSTTWASSGFTSSSGIFNPATRCIIGPGTVVHPPAPPGGDGRAGLPHMSRWTTLVFRARARGHALSPAGPDGLEEGAGGAQIGTTKRGIGPTYADKAARHGIRLGDPRRGPTTCAARLALILPNKNRELVHGAALALEDVIGEALSWARRWQGITDTLPMVQEAVRGATRCCWKASSASCAT